MQILDGKKTSEKILSELKIEISKFHSKPVLDIILVGDDPASLQYVQMKQKKAESIGIGGQLHHLSQNSTTDQVLEEIRKLNQKQNSTAFMAQLPLPAQINTNEVLNSIDPKKDADGLTATNLGLLFQRNSNAIAPATALGVIKLLDEYNIDCSGKNTVIIGRGSEVGIPLVALMMAKNATVTLCHSHTQNLSSICSNADILISAVGKPHFITKDFVKENSVVIDVGLSPDPQTGKLVGDVDFESVSQKAGFITPVPGGVGPMTIACLLFNTVEICKKVSLRETK